MKRINWMTGKIVLLTICIIALVELLILMQSAAAGPFSSEPATAQQSR